MIGCACREAVKDKISEMGDIVKTGQPKRQHGNQSGLVTTFAITRQLVEANRGRAPTRIQPKKDTTFRMSVVKLSVERARAWERKAARARCSREGVSCAPRAATSAVCSAPMRPSRRPMSGTAAASHAL